MYQVTLVLYDAGQLNRAEYAGRIAFEMADLGADDGAQARALDALSRVSQEKGDYDRGVAYARKGLALHDLPDSRVAALHMRLGRSLASIGGCKADAASSLDLALNVTGGLGAFAQAAMIGDVAIGLDQLRRFSEANRLLGDAAERIGEWSPLFRAQYLGRQAITNLRTERLDYAADRMNGIARALPFISSARVNRRVNEILRASAKWNHVREVREARERLEAMQVPETESP
jgi:hypothetical protein